MTEPLEAALAAYDAVHPITMPDTTLGGQYQREQRQRFIDLMRAASKPTPLTLAELEALSLRSTVLFGKQRIPAYRNKYGWGVPGFAKPFSAESLMTGAGPVVLLFRPEEQS